MKILIDTNVLISAILRNRNPERVILFTIGQSQIEWIVSSTIILEYKEVLSRPKFGLPSELLQHWYQIFDEVTTVHEVNDTFQFPRDQKDAKFLDCALSAKADYFITGDKDFTEAQKLVDTIILSVSQFVRLVIDSNI